MPAEDGLGPHDQNGAEKTTDPPGQGSQKPAVERLQAGTLHLAAQDDELVAKEEILGDQGGTASGEVEEEIEDEAEVVHGPVHVPRLDLATSKCSLECPHLRRDGISAADRRAIHVPIQAARNWSGSGRSIIAAGECRIPLASGDVKVASAYPSARTSDGSPRRRFSTGRESLLNLSLSRRAVPEIAQIRRGVFSAWSTSCSRRSRRSRWVRDVRRERNHAGSAAHASTIDPKPNPFPGI